ncbi:MAG TPA: hypothetical protein VGV09_18660 [Steroidobacteraceae bacterium]|nr:hypothetical protein [Steroidobacteraceae bacterium]
MNCKNLLELMAAVAATAALCGCATAPTPRHTTDVPPDAARALTVTRNAWGECVRAAIPPLDDPQSPSEVVARAAMKGCSNEYTAMVQALARTQSPTCASGTDCTRDVDAKAQRWATKTATDAVVSARVQTAGAQVLKCQ